MPKTADSRPKAQATHAAAAKRSAAATVKGAAARDGQGFVLDFANGHDPELARF
jgi:hypothetical protein